MEYFNDNLSDDELSLQDVLVQQDNDIQFFTNHNPYLYQNNNHSQHHNNNDNHNNGVFLNMPIHLRDNPELQVDENQFSVLTGIHNDNHELDEDEDDEEVNQNSMDIENTTTTTTTFSSINNDENVNSITIQFHYENPNHRIGEENEEDDSLYHEIQRHHQQQQQQQKQQQQELDMDYISIMPIDILRLILVLLDTHSIQNVMLVSSLFYELSFDFEIWKPKCKISNLKNLNNTITKATFLNPGFTSGDIQHNGGGGGINFSQLSSLVMTKKKVRFYNNELEPASNDMASWKRLYNDLGSIVLYDTYDLLLEAKESSSQDTEDQSITNTLQPDKTFWSSKGSTIDSNEYLVYKLEQPICIVSSVQIHVYKAFFQPSEPIYSPQWVKISVGFSPNDMHYTSDLFPVEVTDEPQTFTFEPRLVVGGYIRIDLIGKQKTQLSDGLYYTVLRYVCADGRPIGSLYDCPDLCDSMIQFAMKYQSLESLYELISTPTLSSSTMTEIISNHSPSNLLSLLRQMLSPKLDKSRLYRHQMESLLEYIIGGDYEAAVSTIIEHNLRTPKVFNMLLSVPDEKAISKYYIALMSQPDQAYTFSQDESLYVVKEIFESHQKSLFSIIATKLYMSEQLGDYLLYSGHPLIAAHIYTRLHVSDKIIQSLFIAEHHIETINQVVDLLQESSIDVIHLIKLFKDYSLYQAYKFTHIFLQTVANPPFTIEQLKDQFDDLDVSTESFVNIREQLESLIENEEDYHPSIKKKRKSPLQPFFDYILMGLR